MNQVIYKQEGDLIIELSIPLKVSRSNPWQDEPTGKMDNILGVIDGNEIGFAYWIDMEYKDKPDQISEIFYLYQGEPEEFKILCKELGIYVQEAPSMLT
jgi:hypothetical protein